MTEEQSKRDALRSALLGGRKRDSKIVTIDDGIEIEVRQPTIKIRSRIMAQAGVSGENGAVTDIAAIQIAAVVFCAFVPGTNDRIFDAADRQALEEMPTNDCFDEVQSAAMSFMNNEPEAAGKP